MARRRLGECLVEYSHVAGATSRALPVQHVDHVDRTADVAEVLDHALVDAHPAVARMRNDDQLVPGALRPEVAGMTDGHFSQFVCITHRSRN